MYTINTHHDFSFWLTSGLESRLHVPGDRESAVSAATDDGADSDKPYCAQTMSST